MVSSLNKSVLPSSKYLGWGDTGIQETSTDKLQETAVPIVESSLCGEDSEEDPIICAGGLGVGPCRVSGQSYSLIPHVLHRVTVVDHSQ